MSQTPLVIRGNSGHLIVPIVAIPAAAAAAFGYYRDHLPEFCLENAEKVIGIAAALTLALILVARFLKSRYVVVTGDQLRYRSWFTDRTVPATAISAATFETEISGGSDNGSVEHYLTLWQGHEVALKFNSRLWPRTELGELLRRLKRSAPSVRVDLAVERYAAQRGSVSSASSRHSAF